MFYRNKYSDLKHKDWKVDWKLAMHSDTFFRFFPPPVLNHNFNVLNLRLKGIILSDFFIEKYMIIESGLNNGPYHSLCPEILNLILSYGLQLIVCSYVYQILMHYA